MKTENCNLCGRESYRVIYNSTIRTPLEKTDFSVFSSHREYPRIVKCNNCGLVYANPRDEEPVLNKKYEELGSDEYLVAESERTLTFRKDANSVKRYCRSGRILDVGCSTGIFLTQFGDNWEKYGVEPSTVNAKIAKSRFGLNIYNSAINELDFEVKFFNVITMWDVLEHLSNPKDVLKKLYENLKPSGYLIICTPDIGSMFSRVTGKRWLHLTRQHLYYFDRKTLLKTIKISGFSIRRVSTYTRIFTLKYLMRRASIERHIFGRMTATLLNILRLGDLRIRVNFGDFVLVIAQRNS